MVALLDECQSVGTFRPERGSESALFCSCLVPTMITVESWLGTVVNR